MRSKWLLVSIGLVCLLFIFAEAQGQISSTQDTKIVPVPSQPAPTGTTATKGGKQLSVDPINTFRPPSNAEKNAIAKNLKMTPEQTSQMQSIDKQYRADVDALTQQYQKARSDLTTALKDPCPRKERVSSEAQRVSQTHAALLDKEILHWTSIAGVLNQDQECKFWKMFSQQRIQK